MQGVIYKRVTIVVERLDFSLARHKYHKQCKILKQIERNTTRGIFCGENDLISDRSKVDEYCKSRTGS